MKLQLISNSTNFGESYLGFCKPAIADFTAGHHKNIIFIPYAGVTVTWDEYENKVNEVLRETGIRVVSVHHFERPADAIENASCIIAGGGNTFSLLYWIYKNELSVILKNRINSGVPFIGWSAGANIAGPTIKTTNDMPIVFPPSFDALNLVPFQVNPHYTEAVIPGFGGESRIMRLNEFITANPEKYVFGMPEGSILEIQNDQVRQTGKKGVKIFRRNSDPFWIYSDIELNQLYKGILNESSHRS